MGNYLKKGKITGVLVNVVKIIKELNKNEKIISLYDKENQGRWNF